MLLKRDTATDVRSYVPIAKSLYDMDEVTEKILKKFDFSWPKQALLSIK